MLADMHTHSCFSHDSGCAIEDMLLAQRAKGVHIFAVTDHCDTLLHSKQDIYTPIAQSVDEVNRLKKVYPDMQVLSGVELGDGVCCLDVARHVLSLREYDVVIASAHCIKTDGLKMSFADVHLADADMSLVERYLTDYFDEVVQMAEMLDFDILAHLTYPLRYVVDKHHRNVDMTLFMPQIETIFERIIDRSIALEVNTAYTDGKTTVPPPELLELYYKKGGRLITLGSDAHVAANASAWFKEASAILKEIGFSDIYYYKKRKPYPLSIEE